jgi:hypothetical protein
MITVFLLKANRPGVTITFNISPINKPCYRYL